MPFDGSILRGLISAIQTILGHVDGATLIDKLVPLLTPLIPAQWQWLIPIIIALLKQGIPAPTVQAIVDEHIDDHDKMRAVLESMQTAA